MGGAVPGLYIGAIVLVAMAVSFFLLIPMARRTKERSDRVNDPSTATLEYRVPPGQDSVVVLAALETEGYAAAVDPGDTRLVRVDCSSGLEADREPIRSVIQRADTTAIDAGAPMHVSDVRFTDER